jgi:hypothetical protein
MYSDGLQRIIILRLIWLAEGKWKKCENLTVVRPNAFSFWSGGSTFHCYEVWDFHSGESLDYDVQTCTYTVSQLKRWQCAPYWKTEAFHFKSHMILMLLINILIFYFIWYCNMTFLVRGNLLCSTILFLCKKVNWAGITVKVLWVIYIA